MAVVYDKLVNKLLLHDHTGALDSRYVNVTGDTMFGNLDMGGNSILMTDNNGIKWRITVNTDGVLITTQETTTLGTPIGMLLTLTKET